MTPLDRGATALGRLAVRAVKPLLSDAAWQRLRRLDPGARRRDAERKARAARLEHSQRRADAAERQRRKEDLSSWDLTRLARHFKTDKWGRHRYTPHYERHLSHLKNTAFTLLEIGIGGYARAGEGGASLRMWKAYFPAAQIIGLDIEDKSFVDQERIRTVQGSQIDDRVLRAIAADAENLQVVIDDGSHISADVVETFRIMFPLLADGGLYVIEDLQTSYWAGFGGSADLDDPSTSMNFIKRLLDGLNYEEYNDPDYEPSYSELHVVAVHAYHNLVFIEKGTNDEKAARRAKALAARQDEAASTSDVSARAERVEGSELLA